LGFIAAKRIECQSPVYIATYKKFIIEMQARSPPSRIRKYRLLTPLGCTRNSLVFVTSVPGTSEKQAIKLIHHSLMPRARIDNECIIHSLLKYPYVMPLTESFDYQEFRAMLMPRATGGSLMDIASTNPITAGKVIYRLFKGIHYLHSLHILHGDLKPSNVLLMRPDGDEPHPVIIDFGHSANLCCIDSCDCKLMTCAFSSRSSRTRYRRTYGPSAPPFTFCCAAPTWRCFGSPS
jgi:serine/threonine protein kinase